MKLKDFVIRSSLPEDSPKIKAIWKTVFGDSDEVIDSFFDTVYEPSEAIVCEKDGKVISSAFIIPGYTLICPDGREIPCSYLYALATLPKYRGLGLGAEISNHAARREGEKGGFIVLAPASPSLFLWYRESTLVKAASRMVESSFAFRGVEIKSLIPVSAEEYGATRINLLDEDSYFDFPLDVLAWFNLSAQKTGGGFFYYSREDAQVLVAAEVTADTVYAKELLFKGCTLDEACYAVSSHFARDVISRSPSRHMSANGICREQCLALSPDESFPDLEGSFWGLSLD